MSDQRRDDLWTMFLRHRHMVADYIHMLVPSFSDAEDIFQEVGLVVMRHPTGPDDVSRFPAWARAVARHVALQHLRTQRRSRLVFSEALLDVIDRAYDEHEGEADLWNQRRAALSKCLEGLRATDRALLEGRYAEGVDASTLAARISRSPEAVRMKIMRLRQALARCIQRRLAREVAG